jgi:hypothetical protein
MVKKIPEFFFFFFLEGLYFGLKNVVVLKSPKFLTRKKCVFTWQPKHRCVAIDLAGLICLCLCSPGLGIQGFYRQGFALCYSSLIYVWGPTVVLGPISQGTN